MPKGKGERGESINLPEWWLELVNEMINKRSETLIELGALLAKEVGRKSAWDHSAVRKFLDGDVTTREMAIGLARILKIPQPCFDVRTYGEAFEMQAVHDKYDSSSKSNPERDRKLAVVDQVAEAFEEENEDQTPPVQSLDERTNGRRRARRPPKGRSAPS